MACGTGLGCGTALGCSVACGAAAGFSATAGALACFCAGLGAKADGRRNFEMGIWTESTAMIDAVSEQFNQLWEGGQCKTCKRRDVCPVPLEEPAL